MSLDQDHLESLGNTEQKHIIYVQPRVIDWSQSNDDGK